VRRRSNSSASSNRKESGTQIHSAEDSRDAAASAAEGLLSLARKSRCTARWVESVAEARWDQERPTLVVIGRVIKEIWYPAQSSVSADGLLAESDIVGFVQFVRGDACDLGERGGERSIVQCRSL
jgi:hypothetical protein